MEPACDDLLKLLFKCRTQEWSEALEHELDDFENYLSISLERIEDMGPRDPQQEARNAHLVTAMEGLLEATNELRRAALSGRAAMESEAIRERVEACDRDFAQAAGRAR